MSVHHTSIAIFTIAKRLKTEMKMKAACMGATLKDDDDDIEEVEFTEQQEKAMQKAMEEQMRHKGLTPNR